jgi:predicted RNA-binding Zn-ribbon protein involved in translation (DUF1610 family)
MLNSRLCPSCHTPLEIESTEVYNFDPIVLVEETLYRCPICGYEENTEYLKQVN